MARCSCSPLRADPNLYLATGKPCPSLLPAATASAFRLQSKHMRGLLHPRRQTLRVWANAKASLGKRSSGIDVIMVDPLEAKRLAAKQMQEIQAKQKLQRRRQIEAINGAWAMIGLTAGLVIEGQTGKSMLGQLAGYWSAIVSFFIR